MIYGSLSALTRYRGVDPLLDLALDFLQHGEWKQLAPGRVEIDGEQVYANRFDYTTMPEEQAIYEAHLKYIDIHVLLDGTEQILVSDTERMEQTAEDPDADFVGYQGAAECRCRMDTEKFLLVYPGEAHMVKVMLEQACTVKKMVVKVLSPA